MDFFIASAHAAQGGASGTSLMANIFLIAAFVAIFYFMIWRPQSKRAKEHRNLIENLSAGDEVIFAGGLMGKVLKIDEQYAEIQLNGNNTVKIQKASIVAVLSPGTLNQI